MQRSVLLSLVLAPLALLSALAAGPWDGTYVYEQGLGKNPGGIALFVTHTLTINGSECRIDAEGYQTDEHIRCKATANGDKLDVTFMELQGRRDEQPVWQEDLHRQPAAVCLDRRATPSQRPGRATARTMSTRPARRRSANRPASASALVERGRDLPGRHAFLLLAQQHIEDRRQGLHDGRPPRRRRSTWRGSPAHRGPAAR